MRKDTKKAGPSGMSRDQAFTFPERWGGRDCLLPVDVEVIKAMKKDMGGDALLEFVSAEFSARAQVVFDGLNISELSFENIWTVFSLMYPLIFE